MKVLDLGCGKRKYPLAIGIDFSKNSDADIIADLNKGIPVDSKSFDMVYSHHFLEHLLPENKMNIWKEIWRVLRPHGKVKIEVPHSSALTSMAGLEHHTPYSYHTLRDLEVNSNTPRFKIIKARLKWKVLKDMKSLKSRIVFFIPTLIIDFFANLSIDVCERYWCYLVGGFDVITAELEKV